MHRETRTISARWTHDPQAIREAPIRCQTATDNIVQPEQIMGRCKSNMLRWGNTEDAADCEWGQGPQTMEHLLSCGMWNGTCMPKDMAEANDVVFGCSPLEWRYKTMMMIMNYDDFKLHQVGDKWDINLFWGGFFCHFEAIEWSWKDLNSGDWNLTDTCRLMLCC